MDFSVDFFRDEVRNGFYVPTAIKQAWSVSLTILSEIDRICKKYEIGYFADWGTILGAVRHGGFIPWDDDLDICMKRDDYIKFRQVVDAELPAEYMIHDYERQEDHWLFLSRVVHTKHVCFEEKHLNQYHNFPYVVGIDIFLQDYLYPDETMERERCDRILKLIAIADGIVEGRFQRETLEREINEVNTKYHVKLDSKKSARELGIMLYHLAERIMGEVSKEKAIRVGQIFPWILKGAKGLPKEYYEKTVRLPFENTTIPVPAYYHKVLQSRYGNYWEIHKVWGGHDYPFFEGQKKQLFETSGLRIPEFVFDKKMLEKPQREAKRAESFKAIVSECVGQIGKMTHEMEFLNMEERLDSLSECQQLSAELGGFIEQNKGEEKDFVKETIATMQLYCDAIYEAWQCLQPEDGLPEKEGDFSYVFQPLMEAFLKMQQTIQEKILARKEILFLPIGPGEWKGMEDAYLEAISNREQDVTVIPLPMVFKDALGRAIASEGEIDQSIHLEDYPKGIRMTSWKDYNLMLHFPEVIYLQNHYDGQNPCLTVPEQYYAENLRHFTDKLVYLPAFCVDEFEKSDTTSLYNTKHYVTVPGVIYADEVVTQSEHMREIWIERLTEFAGKDTRRFWEQKIIYAEKKQSQTQNHKKTLLFGIGLNEVSENGSADEFLLKLSQKMKCCRDGGAQLQTIVSLYPSSRETWELVRPGTWGDIWKMSKEFGFEILDTEQAMKAIPEITAYYGSVCPLSMACHSRKKPVMIADYQIETSTG